MRKGVKKVDQKYSSSIFKRGKDPVLLIDDRIHAAPYATLSIPTSYHQSIYPLFLRY